MKGEEKNKELKEEATEIFNECIAGKAKTDFTPAESTEIILCIMKMMQRVKIKNP